MVRLIAFILGLIAASPVPAQDAPMLEIVAADEHVLDEYLWLAHPLVIFADSPYDPRFIEQMALIAERPLDLFDRDVIVITDTDPAALSPIREELRPRGFGLVLIGKDGQKYLRKPTPWNVRELTRSIDKMPIRQQELDELRGK